jgi:hypothetical protein
MLFLSLAMEAPILPKRRGANATKGVTAQHEAHAIPRADIVIRKNLGANYL